MSQPVRSTQAGFSLLEAIISLGMFLVLVTVVMSVYTPSRVIYARSERQTNVQQNARLAMAEMSRSIRMTGFFPENFSSAPPVTTLSDPILVATDRALAIHGDGDSSGASNVFLFCRDGDIVRRGKGALDANGAYVCAGGEVLAESVTDLRFTYYDSDGNTVPATLGSGYQLDDQPVGAVPSLDDTTERASVRRVVITLTVEAEPVQGKSQVFHLSSDVALRNAG